MKVLFLFLGIVLMLQFSQVFAEPVVINYEKCDSIRLNKIAAPWYMHIDHDPASGQVIKHNVPDNPSITPYHRVPEQNVPEGEIPQATWFEFGSSVNATATYEMELDLKYRDPSDLPRPVKIQIFSVNNELVLEKRIFQEGNEGCIAASIHAEPPKPELTKEQILQVAKLEFVGITDKYSQDIQNNTSETRGLKIALIVTIIMAIATAIMMYLNQRNMRAELEQAKTEFMTVVDMISTASTQLQDNRKYDDLRLKMVEKRVEKLSLYISNNFGNLLHRVDSWMAEQEKKSKISAPEIKTEIPPTEMSQKSADDKTVVTFAQTDQSIESSTEMPIPLPEPESKENKFGFDLDSIKSSAATAKNLLNRLKKEDASTKQQLSDDEKFKKDCEEKDLAELHKLFSEYVVKADNDTERFLENTENQKRAAILIGLINQKTLGMKK